MDRKRRAEMLKGREVRRLTTSQMECREVDGTLHLGGYASTTAHAYDMGWYNETIGRGAFKRTLAGTPDVQLLVNHEGLPLARTTNGTLTLSEDDIGLAWDATLDAEDPEAARVARKVESGLMDQCSFAFRVITQAWDEEYENREITEVALDRGDVSIVNQGANPMTSVNVRSLFGEMAAFSDDELAELRDDPVIITVIRRLTVATVVVPPAPVPEAVVVPPPSTGMDLDLARARAFASRIRGR